MADYWNVTMEFKKGSFEHVNERLTLQSIVKHDDIATKMLGIPLGFSAYEIGTNDPDINCLALARQDDDLEIPVPTDLDEYYYIQEPMHPYYLNGGVNCLPKLAYDIIFDELKIGSLNQLFEIVFYVAIAVFGLMFVLLWWCCYGFCECKCCGIFVMCCDDKGTAGVSHHTAA